MFDDAETIVGDAIKAAEKAVASHRTEAARLRAELKQLAKKRDDLTSLLSDPVVTPLAREAIVDQLGDTQAKRTTLQNRLDGLVDEASGNSQRLADAVKQAFSEARESFDRIATPAQFNEFLRQQVGELVVNADGAISQGKTAPDSVGAVSPAEDTPRAGLEPAT